MEPTGRPEGDHHVGASARAEAEGQQEEAPKTVPAPEESEVKVSSLEVHMFEIGNAKYTAKY